MSGVPFTKMHGLGNDFVVIDRRRRPVAVGAAAARAIADRRRGVGCDQILLIDAGADGADATMRILNADGGEVGACGNGARAVAQLLMAESGRDGVAIATAGGRLAATRAGGGLITIDLGPARLDWRDIPLARAHDTLALPVAVEGLKRPVGVSVGNPHAVFFVDDADSIDLARLGPGIEHHPLFPERTNVEVASLAGPDRLRMRVWERGVGITQACGTGAAATAVAAHRRGLTGRRVEVLLDGGPLEITWTEDDRVLKTGPAVVSFTGILAESLLAGEAISSLGDRSH